MQPERNFCEESLKIVRNDLSSQLRASGSTVFINEQVYDSCYETIKDTIDYSSLSRFLLKYHPDIGVHESLQMFGQSNSPAGRLYNLLKMGGNKYGFHLVYLALKEDDPSKPGRKEAIAKLEETARAHNSYTLESERTNHPLAFPIPAATMSSYSSDDTPQGADIPSPQGTFEVPPNPAPNPPNSPFGCQFGLPHNSDCKCGNCDFVSPLKDKIANKLSLATRNDDSEDDQFMTLPSLFNDTRNNPLAPKLIDDKRRQLDNDDQNNSQLPKTSSSKVVSVNDTVSSTIAYGYRAVPIEESENQQSPADSNTFPPTQEFSLPHHH